MGKSEAAGENRFGMVKERHRKTFEEAAEKKLADDGLVPLCGFIAGTKNFFTSSGCAGRIILLQLPKGECKKGSSFHRRWHRPVSFLEVKKALGEKTRGEVWLKVEPFIMHIGTNSIANAREILAIMNRAGVKRGGILVAKEGKFLVELQGTQEMSAPVKQGNKLLAGDAYLQYLVKKANCKIGKNREMLARFERECRACMK